MSDGGWVDDSPHLGSEEADQLIEAMRELRHVHKVKYRELAKQLKVADTLIWNINAGRVKPTQHLADAFYAFVRTSGIRLGDPTITVADFQLSVAREMGLDKEILAADVDRIKGTYLCYTLNRDGIGVTCLTLYKSPASQWWPEFTAWRPGLTVQGYYYIYRKVLYLIGHISETAFPRVMTFWPDKSVHSSDLIGTITSSTRNDLSMFTWCYLRRADEDELRGRRWKDLGQISIDELRERDRIISDFFEGRTVTAVALPSDV